MLAGCAQLVPAPVADPAPEPLEAWQRVLERFVDDSGRVDYVGLARERADLDRFVAWIHATGIGGQGLAYHLNAYNALAMYNALERGVPGSLDGFEKLRFFVLRQFDLVIRPLGDERVHFALNCMAAGCPKLPRAPFRAESLAEALERETRLFLNEARHVQVDHAARAVRLSSILDFYQEDFLAKAPTLVAYVNQYRSERIPDDYRVEFIPYDWKLNARTRPSYGRALRVFSPNMN